MPTGGFHKKYVRKKYVEKLNTEKYFSDFLKHLKFKFTLHQNSSLSTTCKSRKRKFQIKICQHKSFVYEMYYVL